MAWLVAAAAALAVLTSFPAARAELPDTQPCPAACACRYDRISWMTDCARRGLNATPDGLSPDAYSLDLAGNRVEKLGPFPEGSRLRRLLASDNQLSAVKAADIAGLELLVEIDLSRNQLKEIDAAAFRSCAGLLTLRLAENQLQAPSGALLNSNSLKNLDLRSNRLQTLPSGAFANCSSLATLDLSDNPLGALPAAAFAPLTSLETLSVARCGLETLDTEALAPLAQLKSLDASGNRLGAAGRWAAALRPLARLDSLSLAASALEGPLPAGAFARCASLRRLVMAKNPALRDPWRAVAPLPALAELQVSHCGLRALADEEERANLTTLRLLDASDNPLGPALPPGALALPLLETLLLARCGLRHPPDHNTFSEEGEDGSAGAPELETLSLAGNQLQLSGSTPLLPGPAQDALRSLDLSNCSLRQLPGVVVRGANNLTELFLADNALDEVPEDALRELPALSTLDLRRCRLREARHEQLAHSPRLRALRLRGNPWMCGCALRDLWAWAEQGKGDLGVLDAAHNLTCVTGASGERRTWADEVAAGDCGGGKSVRRRAAATAERHPAAERGIRPALFAPAAAALVVGAAAALAVALHRRRKRSAAKLRRLYTP